MKLTRSIIATAIITLLAMGAVLYTSCTKDRCAKLACQNGGACVNGYCSCPTGFEGDHCETPVTTTLLYYNHTLTDLTLTLNNVAYTIPAGHSKGFTGGYGDTLNGNAFTRGDYGETIVWDSVNNTFPQSGTHEIDFHVSSDYFFLVVLNDSSSSLLKEINPNYGLPTERDIILPPPYIGFPVTRTIGYFYASAASNVHILSSTRWGWSFTSLGLPMTQDQAYEAITN